jgi:tripartite-type tricarboxylate transporter receptor subunit TctC
MLHLLRRRLLENSGRHLGRVRVRFSQHVPDVPIMQEAGVPGYISKDSFGLLAPAGIKKKIADDVPEILTRPDVVEARGKLSFTVSNAGTADFRAMITTETQKWSGVVRRLNIKIE